MELNGFLWVLYMISVFRSAGESTDELWNRKDTSQVFLAVMSLERLKQRTEVLRFDDNHRPKRLARRAKDKLAPIRDVWNNWIQTVEGANYPPVKKRK